MAVNKKSGTMKAPVKFSPMTLEKVTITYSHIQKPDLEYNTGHSVTVEWNNDIAKMFSRGNRHHRTVGRLEPVP